MRFVSTPLRRPSVAFPAALSSLNVLSARCCRSSSAVKGPLTSNQRVDVELKASDLDESFVKGSGKGGQKINKVRNCVLLTHLPTGLQVRTQKTRSLADNRRVARQLLLQKLDDHVNGSLSKHNENIAQLRRKKANRRAKAKQKYATATTEGDEQDIGDDAGEDNSDSEDECIELIESADIDSKEGVQGTKRRNEA
ncbi:unnamed protein product [Hyaloperonospora brassicae]|uniref:Prokaryotic-type class I peptide chain release factors domain-containing protein n=1 Tax=Hyaloperonospora brassicae TaxID=162125 RepID=A0AAV0U4T5_HYABA|nr:unnamed protein product [Hyaloperonospora brassicae]